VCVCVYVCVCEDSFPQGLIFYKYDKKQLHFLDKRENQ